MLCCGPSTAASTDSRRPRFGVDFRRPDTLPEDELDVEDCSWVTADVLETVESNRGGPSVDA